MGLNFDEDNFTAVQYESEPLLLLKVFVDELLGYSSSLSQSFPIPTAWELRRSLGSFAPVPITIPLHLPSRIDAPPSYTSIESSLLGDTTLPLCLCL